MDSSIIRVGLWQTIGLAILALFLTFAAFVVFGGPIPAALAFSVFGIAWFAAVTAEQEWVRISALTVIGIATVLVAAIVAFFWAAYA